LTVELLLRERPEGSGVLLAGSWIVHAFGAALFSARLAGVSFHRMLEAGPSAPPGADAWRG
jgi:hypothetical protein